MLSPSLLLLLLVLVVVIIVAAAVAIAVAVVVLVVVVVVVVVVTAVLICQLNQPTNFPLVTNNVWCSFGDRCTGAVFITWKYFLAKRY